MAAAILRFLHVGLLLCAAWGALTAGQTATTGPVQRQAPTRPGAKKNAPAQKHTTDSPRMAGDEGPAAPLQKRFDAAALELQEARRLAPDDSETAVTLAFTYLREQQLEKAQKIFAELLQRHGESPQMHIMFGAAYRETEYVNQAVAEFKRAVALDANYPRLHYYMALAYLSQEGSHAIPQALAELTDEILRHPGEYSAHYLAGLIYVQERKLQEALPYLEKAASLEPTNPDAPLYLGQALYLLDRTDLAVSVLQKSVALTKDPSRNQYQVAKAHYLLGQFFN